MQRSMMRDRLGKRWLRGLLLGALAALPLLVPEKHALAALAADASAGRVEIVGGRLRGELRGMQTDQALDEIAALLGARVRWAVAPGEDKVTATLTGLTIREAIARLLRGRSYLLELGQRREIRVLSGEGQLAIAGPSARQRLNAENREPGLQQMQRMAEIDRLVHPDDEDDDINEDAVETARQRLSEIVTGSDAPAVRLAAAEKLFVLDRGAAETTLPWLTSDSDPMVRERAEVLLAAARADNPENEHRSSR